MQTGEKVAYAKRFYGYDSELTKKIQATETQRFTNTPANQQPVSTGRIPQNAENVNNEFSSPEEAAEAEEISDSKVQYSLCKADPPKETGVAYKVFFVKDGKLNPPMVANHLTDKKKEKTR